MGFCISRLANRVMVLATTRCLHGHIWQNTGFGELVSESGTISSRALWIKKTGQASWYAMQPLSCTTPAARQMAQWAHMDMPVFATATLEKDRNLVTGTAHCC